MVLNDRDILTRDVLHCILCPCSVYFDDCATLSKPSNNNRCRHLTKFIFKSTLHTMYYTTCFAEVNIAIFSCVNVVKLVCYFTIYNFRLLFLLKPILCLLCISSLQCQIGCDIKVIMFMTIDRIRQKSDNGLLKGMNLCGVNV